MPVKKRVSREDIVEAAFALVRENAVGALSARSVAARLGCSTQPIFSNFAGMEELTAAVIGRAWRFYLDRTAADMAAGRYLPYKASGMSYITFAAEEPHLFALLFMRDRSAEGAASEAAHPAAVIDEIVRVTGMCRDDALRFHDEMWVFVHGLAVMAATRFSVFSEEAASAMLSDIYNGLRKQYQDKGVIPNDRDRDQGPDQAV